MSIFDRISFLLRANIEDLLQQTSDPEKEVDRVLREMDASILEAKQNIALMISQEKALDTNLAEAMESAKSWRAQAERATRADSDNSALEALRAERDARRSIQIYERQIESQRDAIKQLRHQLKRLQLRRQSIESDRQVLTTRLDRARALSDSESDLAVSEDPVTARVLAGLEETAAGAESLASASRAVREGSKDEQFAELESEASVRSELDLLKKSLGS